jgi:hypothetical protein
VVHLNDSKAGLGSRLDRHEHIGAGRIGEVGLRHLVTNPALRGVPMFLETPGMDEGYDAINMDRVRSLIAGEPLPSLPPEAFKLRGRQPRRGRTRRRVTPAIAARWAARFQRHPASGGIIWATARVASALAGVTVVRSCEGESGAVRGIPTSRPIGTKRLYERNGATLRLVA